MHSSLSPWAEVHLNKYKEKFRPEAKKKQATFLLGLFPQEILFSFLKKRVARISCDKPKFVLIVADHAAAIKAALVGKHRTGTVKAPPVRSKKSRATWQ